MLRKIFFTIVLFSLTTISFAQKHTKPKVSGIIKTVEGKPVEYMEVFLKNTGYSGVTNEEGYFEIEAPTGDYILTTRSISSDKKEYPVTIKGDTKNYYPDLTVVERRNVLDEVVVSASRIPELKNNSSASVAIITPKQITELSQITPDISFIVGNYVSGLALPSNTTSNRSQTLRGRSVLVLIDGIPQSTPLRSTDRDLRTIDPMAVERIEIVKGATSIYGNGAIGGIINIITKKSPKNITFGGATNVGISDHDIFNNKRASGYQLNQQFYGNKDNFDYLISGSVSQTGSDVDGDGKYVSPRYGLGDTRTYNLLAKLGYKINPKNSLELMYNFYSSLQNSPLVAKGGKYLQEPRIGVIGERDPQAKKEGTRYNHNAYLKYNSRQLFTNTDLELSVYMQRLYTLFDFRKHNPKKPRWEETSGQATIKADKIGVRGQLTSKVAFCDDISSYLSYGIDMLFDKTSQPLVDGRYWVPKMKSRNFAPFAQTKTTFFNDLSLKLGLRYDNIVVDIPDYDVLALKKTDPKVSVKGGDLKYRNVSFNAGLSYTRIKEAQPFVSFSQGFSIFDLGRILRSAKEDVLSKVKTDPVKTSNYEVGAYSRPMDKLSLSASFFYTYSKLGSDLKSENGFWVVDRSPQKVYGFEVNADYDICRQVSAGGNFSYFEGKKKSENESWTYMSGLSIPASKLALYVNFKPIKDSYLNLYYIHTGKRDRFDKNPKGLYNEGEGVVKRINLFNLTAGYTYKTISYGLGIENLFDKTYYTSSSMIMARDDEYARGNGRVVRFSLTYRF